jgi:hypothetical protein
MVFSRISKGAGKSPVGKSSMVLFAIRREKSLTLSRSFSSARRGDMQGASCGLSSCFLLCYFPIA